MCAIAARAQLRDIRCSKRWWISVPSRVYQIHVLLDVVKSTRRCASSLNSLRGLVATWYEATQGYWICLLGNMIAIACPIGSVRELSRCAHIINSFLCTYPKTSAQSSDQSNRYYSCAFQWLLPSSWMATIELQVQRWSYNWLLQMALSEAFEQGVSMRYCGK